MFNFGCDLKARVLAHELNDSCEFRVHYGQKRKLVTEKYVAQVYAWRILTLNIIVNSWITLIEDRISPVSALL